jgi:hypothetical protein
MKGMNILSIAVLTSIGVTMFADKLKDRRDKEI